MILLDTSGLLANYDRTDRHHAAVARVLARPQQRILSPFVLAELDYLIANIANIAGQASELLVLDDVARGAYQLESLHGSDVAAAAAIIERYADLRLGLADASIVVLAETSADNRCGYCRTAEKFCGAQLEPEHLEPRSLRGDSTEANLWLACRSCNAHKGARTSAIDPLTGAEAPLFNPRTQSWVEHFR